MGPMGWGYPPQFQPGYHPYPMMGMGMPPSAYLQQPAQYHARQPDPAAALITGPPVEEMPEEEAAEGEESSHSSAGNQEEDEGEAA